MTFSMRFGSRGEGGGKRGRRDCGCWQCCRSSDSTNCPSPAPTSQVDEDLEFEYLSCRYDRWLINRAIKTQQQLAAHTYVVEAFVVYKVRREAKLSSEAIIGMHRNCAVPPYALHLTAVWAAAFDVLVK